MISELAPVSVPPRYRLRHAACAPLLPGAEPSGAAAAILALDTAAQARLPEVIEHQGLAPLWQTILAALPSALPPSLVAVLNETCTRAARRAAATYLLQRHAAAAAERALAAADIPWVRIKGAALRERLYAEPFRRPADDIDLLIRPQDRTGALAALAATGFVHAPKPANLTHETTLRLGTAALDLHWSLMRPARLRVDPTDAFIAGRHQVAGHWAPPDPLHLMLLLTHPVFAKYATTPEARLIRAIDLARWLDQQPPDWEIVISHLDRAGLRTAAWITLRWLARVTGHQVPAAIIAELSPGPFRRRWLRVWIDHDLPTRLMDRTALIQLGLTLPAQDTAGDAWRMLLWGRTRRRHRPV